MRETGREGVSSTWSHSSSSAECVFVVGPFHRNLMDVHGSNRPGLRTLIAGVASAVKTDIEVAMEREREIDS